MIFHREVLPGDRDVATLAATRGFVSVVLVFLGVQAAFASEPGNPPDWCRNGAFATDQDNLKLVRVLRRTGLLMDSGQKKGCPQAGAACALGGSHADASDELLINSELPGFFCAYRPANGDGGWVAKSDVVVEPQQPTTQPPLAAWTGQWHDGDNRIAISRHGEALTFSGQASWAEQNSGSFGGTATPNGATARVTDDACTVTLRLLGRYLVADDNAECGGMNVRFTGVYRRR
jgi:hypothetical protein